MGPYLSNVIVDSIKKGYYQRITGVLCNHCVLYIALAAEQHVVLACLEGF